MRAAIELGVLRDDALVARPHRRPGLARSPPEGSSTHRDRWNHRGRCGRAEPPPRWRCGRRAGRPGARIARRLVRTAIMPQPMSTPTAAGMIARLRRDHAPDRRALAEVHVGHHRDVPVNERHPRDALQLRAGLRLERNADRPGPDRYPAVDVDDLVGGRHLLVRLVGHGELTLQPLCQQATDRWAGARSAEHPRTPAQDISKKITTYIIRYT